jgi:acyl-CoA synthetase (AMP-forming)/AMP-acid ligase II
MDTTAPDAPTTIGGALLRTAARRPEHEALVFPPARFTYRELTDHSVQAARSLAALGVGRGDHVGLLLPNCPDFVFAFFGAQLLGAIVVPVNTRFRTRELAYVAENADLDLLVTSDIVEDHVDFVERLSDSLPGLADASDPERLALEAAPRLRAIVLLGAREAPGMVTQARFTSLAGTVESEHVLAAGRLAQPDEPALMLYTSGTTAQPKGCLMTHDAALHSWCSAARRLQIAEDDRMWDALPLFHMSCLGPLLFMVELGGTLISTTHFEPGPALDAIEREEATWLYSVFPPIVMSLIKDPSFDDHDLSRVRGMLNVAPPETMRLIQAAFPQAVNVGGHFGMTEASGAITCNYFDATPDQQAETHGAPLPDTAVRVVDPDTGEVLGPGRPGELQVQGRGLMIGYYRDPELTAERLTEDGWLRSGDLGVIDDAGLVTYQARLKDMLKVGGENVSPAEIESHLSTLPAVKLVQVVGAPDDRLGEVVAVFIEVAPGHRLTEKEVIDHCGGAIASFKVPRYVRFVEDWPMSATKIQKFRLREQITAELEGRAP